MNTEDWELLEMAAKAAGLEGYRTNYAFLGLVKDKRDDKGKFLGYQCWNPLTDDGDALRLAAALKFTVDFESGAVWGAGDLDETRLGHTTVDDPCIRRAIVRAAAEIGRRMA